MGLPLKAKSFCTLDWGFGDGDGACCGMIPLQCDYTPTTHTHVLKRTGTWAYVWHEKGELTAVDVAIVIKSRFK